MSTRQQLDPTRTPWHITWGTYGTRLHGGERATVDRQHNHRGEAFIGRDPWREDLTSAILNFDPIRFTDDEREVIEYFLPSLCERGGWTYRIAACCATSTPTRTASKPAPSSSAGSATRSRHCATTIALQGLTARDEPARYNDVMLAPFHVNIFARSVDTIEGPPVELNGVSVTPLRSSNGAPLTHSDFFPVSFEQVYEALLRIPRLDAEPDGFFVLAGGAGPTHWRVSGHLYDFDGRLHRMELNGECPQESFDALIATLGAPPSTLTFELVEQGAALSHNDFHLWASRGVLDSSKLVVSPRPPRH
jgi:hypothetical protein